MGKRTIFYDYRSNVDIVLPSHKRLYKRLGDYDTLAEYTMLSLLDFEKYYDRIVTFEEYVTEKAKEHQVNLRGGVTLGNYKTALIKSFMVNSYAILSDFIKYYRDDIRNLFTRDFNIANDDKVSELSRLLKSLETLDIKPTFPDWLLPCMEYYRHVRNSVAHNTRDKDACEKAYVKIDRDKLKADYWVFEKKAPNSTDEISMDDFYFYSACIKHVANYLVMALKGRVTWDALGATHIDLMPENIKKGTETVRLVNNVFMQYNHRFTKEEQRKVIDMVKEKMEEYKLLKR